MLRPGLVAAVRDAATKLVESGGQPLAEVFHALDRRPWKIFTGNAPSINPKNPNWGLSNAWLGTFKAERRYQNGFGLTLAYTYTTWVDNVPAVGDTSSGDNDGLQDIYNRAGERSGSNYTIPYRLVAAPIWDLPFGHGRRIGAHWHPVLDAVAGGWQCLVALTYLVAPELVMSAFARDAASAPAFLEAGRRTAGAVLPVLALLGLGRERRQGNQRVLGRDGALREAVERHHGFDRVGPIRRDDERQHAAHAEADDADAVARDGGVTRQIIDCAAHVAPRAVGRQALHQVRRFVHLVVRRQFAVVEIGRQRHEPGLRQPIGHLLDAVVQTPPLVYHNHRGELPVNLFRVSQIARCSAIIGYHACCHFPRHSRAITCNFFFNFNFFIINNNLFISLIKVLDRDSLYHFL